MSVNKITYLLLQGYIPIYNKSHVCLLIVIIPSVFNMYVDHDIQDITVNSEFSSKYYHLELNAR